MQGKNSSSFSDCAEKRANILKNVYADVRLLRLLNIRKKIIEFGFRCIKNYAGSAPRSFHNSS